MPPSPDDAITAFLQYKTANEGRAQATIGKYRQWYDRWLEYLAELDVDLFDATKDHLVAFTGMHLFEQKMSPASRRVAVAALRGLYEWAHEEGYIDKNPAGSLVYPKSGTKLPVAMGLANAEKLLMAPDLSTFLGIRDAAMLAVMMGTGLRVGGLCALNDSHVLQYRHGENQRIAIKVTEKGGKERVLPLPLDGMILLQAYLGHPELDEIDRRLENGDQVLFVSMRNRRVPECDYRGEARRISENGVLRVVKRHAEAAGIPMNEAHPHAIRHLMGTELAEDSATAIELKNILGHADANTSEIYTRLAIRKMTAIIDASSPLSKIQSPVKALVNELKRSGQL